MRTFKPFQRRCGCDYSKCYQFQCVYEVCKYGRLIPEFFSKRWLRRDTNTKSTFIGSYKNPSTCDSVQLTQECSEIEESGVLDNWKDHEEVIDVDEKDDHSKLSSSASDDESMKVLHFPKISNKLNYQDFSSISNQLFNACERNSQYATFVGGMMLKLLSVVDKHQNNTDILDNLDENLTKHFPDIIDNYKCMFGKKSKNSTIANNLGPARAVNSHFATNKRLMSTMEKKKRESMKKRKQSCETNSPFPFISDFNESNNSDDTWIPEEENMVNITELRENMVNITEIRPNKRGKKTCGFCKSNRHQAPGCTDKLKYGKEWKPSEAMDYITDKAPFKLVDRSRMDEIIYDWNTKLVSHVVLHNIQCKININGIRPSKNEMIVELTALGRNGQELPGYIRCLVFGPQVFSHLMTKYNAKDRYIFNKIQEESVGSEYRLANLPGSMDMYGMMRNGNNMFGMPDNNMMQMNRNRQFPLFPPQNMFACPMIPFGYGHYNQMNSSNQDKNDNNPWSSN